jgi:hypothetical protein
MHQPVFLYNHEKTRVLLHSRYRTIFLGDSQKSLKSNELVRLEHCFGVCRALLWWVWSNALVGAEQCFGGCGAMSSRNKLS